MVKCFSNNFFNKINLQKKWHWLKFTWFKFALALWLTGLTSALLSPDPYFTFSQGFIWIRFPLYAVAVQTWLARDRDIRILMLVSMCLGMLIMCFILGAELIFEPLDKDGLIKTRLIWPYGDLTPGGYLSKVSLPLFCILVAITVNRFSKVSGFYGLTALGHLRLTLFGCFDTFTLVRFYAFTILRFYDFTILRFDDLTI